MIALVQEANQAADQQAADQEEEGRAELRAVLLAVVKNLRQQRGRIAPGGVPQAGLQLARERRSGRKTAVGDRPAVPGRVLSANG